MHFIIPQFHKTPLSEVNIPSSYLPSRDEVNMVRPQKRRTTILTKLSSESSLRTAHAQALVILLPLAGVDDQHQSVAE